MGTAMALKRPRNWTRFNSASVHAEVHSDSSPLSCLIGICWSLYLGYSLCRCCYNSYTRCVFRALTNLLFSSAWRRDYCFSQQPEYLSASCHHHHSNSHHSSWSNRQTPTLRSSYLASSYWSSCTLSTSAFSPQHQQPTPIIFWFVECSPFFISS